MVVVAMFSPLSTTLGEAEMVPPLKRVHGGSRLGMQSPPCLLALICKQPLEELYSHLSSGLQQRATGFSDGALFAELSCCLSRQKLHQRRDFRLTNKSAESFWNPSAQCFPQDFVISNLREKQLNRPIFFSEISAKAYPRARG